MTGIDLLEALRFQGVIAREQAERMLGSAQALREWRADCVRLDLPVQHGEDDSLLWRPVCDVLSARDIASALAEAGQQAQVRVHLYTDSTNRRLLDAAAAGESGPIVCFAECQSAGRGRRQRSWQARFGHGLLWSALVDSGRPVSELPGLAIMAGAVLAQALVAWAGDLRAGPFGIGLKWPNDLVAADGKLGGILVEAVPGSAAQARAVIGVGLNLLPPLDVADQPVSALSRLMPFDIAVPGIRNQLAGRLAAALLAGVDRFRRDGLAPFLPVFARYDVLAGRPVWFEHAGRQQHGEALGLAADGALRVRTDEGERSLYSAEVSVRAMTACSGDNAGVRPSHEPCARGADGE